MRGELALGGWGGFRAAGLILIATAAALLLALTARSVPTDLSLPFSGADGEAQAERAYGELPLAFERDAGRNGPKVDFLARSSAGTFIGAQGATLTLSDGKQTEAVRLALQGASPTEPEAIRRLPGEMNYLVGDDPAAWRTEIPTFERVRYPGVYPGIALDWHGTQGSLEYDFLLAAGADPSRIALQIRGANSVRVAANGDLVIDTGAATVRQQAPVAYQRIAGQRRSVAAAFVLDGGARTVGFELGAYEYMRPLTIDPVILSYSTYLGGDADDFGDAIAVDAAGAAYVTGATGSTDFNAVGQIEGDSAAFDVFVSKLTPSGNALAYSTYLGGSGHDVAEGGGAIAVDSSGAAYLTGYTESTDFNLVGQIEGDSAGVDAFVSKLTPAGSGLSYSTYLGGDGEDVSDAIAVDAAGAAYVTGYTGSTDFNTVGEIEGNSAANDAFVSKLTPAGGGLSYSTYLGGDDLDFGGAIAVDAAGAAYITGGTLSTDFNLVGQIEGDSAGFDAFVSELTPAGNALSYSTYLGGDAGDFGRGIAVDPSGAAYVTGSTGSTDFNTVGQIEGDSASTDAFVSKLTPPGSALSYSTYLGGDGSDGGLGIAVDPSGAAYVTGDTRSTDFNTVGQIEADSAGTDAFVSKLTPAGSALSYSTYLGGDDSDIGRGIAVDPSGAAYVTGDTRSTDFNTVGQIEGDSATTDAFVSKLAFDSDGDGVPDSADACPDQAAATQNGCPPAAPGKAARTLTLDASKSKVKEGKKVGLSGEIETVGNVAACEANQTVELQRKKQGSSFKDFKTDTTDAQGEFSTKAKVKKTATYRAELPETAVCEDDLSNTKKVKAKKKP